MILNSGEKVAKQPQKGDEYGYTHNKMEGR
jgi:hypothetical protein